MKNRVKIAFFILSGLVLSASCADNDTALDYPNVEIHWKENVQGYPNHNLGTIEAPPTVLVPIASGEAYYDGPESIPPKYEGGNFFFHGTGNEGPITNAFDGTATTWFHTPYGDFNSENMFPIRLEFTLEGSPEKIDYLNLVPRDPGGNGEIRTVELFILREGETEYESYGVKAVKNGLISYMFRPAVENPRKLRLVITESSGGFVSLGEIECGLIQNVYKEDMKYFADDICTTLKPEYSREDLEAIPTPFFRNLALAIYDGSYDLENRLFDVKTYPNPIVKAEENCTAPYGIADNATGIYVDWNDCVVIFVEDNLCTDMTARFINPMETGLDAVQAEALQPGVNVFTAKEKSLLYLIYQDDREVTTKVHVATGKVNGVFDTSKHGSADWKPLLEKATFSHFDLLGKYTHLVMTTPDLMAYVPDGKELLDIYDRIVYMEQDFCGFTKYTNSAGKLRFNDSRICMMAVNTKTFMYAANFYTGYSLGSLGDILDVENLKTAGIWGPAHEVGHINQIRPGFKWGGYEVDGDMTEVTNNVLALYVQTELGNESRLITEGYYPPAFNRFFVAEEPYDTGMQGEYVFEKLVPLWQLYLYFTKVLGDEDFYKRLLESIIEDETYDRYTEASSAQVLYCKNRFAYHASRAAGVNLVQFFEDYQFRLEQSTKDEIESWGLPAPKHLFRYISDVNYDLYRDSRELVPGTAVVNYIDGDFHVSINDDCRNAVAYEVYIPSDPVKPVYVTPERVFTTMTASNRIIVKAVDIYGNRTELPQSTI